MCMNEVLSASNSAWSYRALPFQLPPHVRLMLADVDAGSDTPSLVGKVLKWRKENPEEGQSNPYLPFLPPPLFFFQFIAESRRSRHSSFIFLLLLLRI